MGEWSKPKKKKKKSIRFAFFFFKLVNFLWDFNEQIRLFGTFEKQNKVV